MFATLKFLRAGQPSPGITNRKRRQSTTASGQCASSSISSNVTAEEREHVDDSSVQRLRSSTSVNTRCSSTYTGSSGSSRRLGRSGSCYSNNSPSNNDGSIDSDVSCRQKMNRERAMALLQHMESQAEISLMFNGEGLATSSTAS